MLLFFNSYEKILYKEYFPYIGVLGTIQVFSISMYLFWRRNLPKVLSEFQLSLVQYFKERRSELEKIIGERVTFPDEEEPSLSELMEEVSQRFMGGVRTFMLFFGPIFMFLIFILLKEFFIRIDPRVFYVLFSLYTALIVYCLSITIVILMAYHFFSDFLYPMAKSRAFLDTVLWPLTLSKIQEALEE